MDHLAIGSPSSSFFVYPPDRFVTPTGSFNRPVAKGDPFFQSVLIFFLGALCFGVVFLCPSSTFPPTGRFLFDLQGVQFSFLAKSRCPGAFTSNQLPFSYPPCVGGWWDRVPTGFCFVWFPGFGMCKISLVRFRFSRPECSPPPFLHGFPPGLELFFFGRFGRWRRSRHPVFPSLCPFFFRWFWIPPSFSCGLVLSILQGIGTRGALVSQL